MVWGGGGVMRDDVDGRLEKSRDWNEVSSVSFGG